MTDNRMAEQHETEPSKAGGGAKPASSQASAQPGGSPAKNGGQTDAGNESTVDLSLRDQLEAARAERDANYDLYLRSQAELQNYRKRAQKEADEMRLYQAMPLARDLLPALDNLHRALAAAETTKDVDKLVEGLRLVTRQIDDALSRHHIIAIDAAGKPFDPNLHQAVQQVPTDLHPPMTVVQEVERGFKLKDRVVRPAAVIVAQAPKGDDAGGEPSKS